MMLLNIYHFLLYEVLDYMWAPDVVELADQFNWEPEVWVYEPIYFANPVQKTFGEVTPILHPDWHMVFYDAPGAPLEPPEQFVVTINQFQFWEFTVTLPYALGVPSYKTGWSLLPP